MESSEETKLPYMFQKYITAAVVNSHQTIAVLVEAIYRKYGREGVEVMKKAVYDLNMEKTKKLIETVKPEKRDLRTLLTQILPQLDLEFHVLGIGLDRIEFREDYSHSHVTSCPALDAWKTVVNDPEVLGALCEIISFAADKARTDAFNPKIQWTCHPEIGGQEGLARGKPYCRMVCEHKK